MFSKTLDASAVLFVLDVLQYVPVFVKLSCFACFLSVR